jgi:tRNA nucleotidyltransferase (CCA-adding enzyme)
MHIATTHNNTDFDGLASMIAVTLLQPGTIAVCPGNVNPNVQRFLALHKTSFNIILAKEVDLEAVTSLTVTDTNQWRRLERVNELKDKEGIWLVLWDHHMGEGDIEPDEQHIEKIGATITLLVREILNRKIQLTPFQATLFLLGIYEDTGQLTFSSTTPEDAHTAAFLLEQGADLTVVVEFLSMAYDEVQKQVLFSLMDEAEEQEFKGKRVRFAIIQLDKYVELAGVVQLYSKLVNAAAVFIFFVNKDGGIFIIGRSHVLDINVNTILQKFGGGGHPGAGSATISHPQKNVEAFRDEIIAALHEEEQQHNGIRVADIMTSPVTTVPPNTLMTEIRDLMDKEKIRGVIVAEDGRMQGIMVLWDLKRLTLRKHWKSHVKAFMRRDVTSIDSDALASDVADMMVQKGIGHLPVIEDDKVIGIVTRTDIINYLYRNASVKPTKAD